MCVEEAEKFAENKSLKADDVENQKGNGTTRMKLRFPFFCDVPQPDITEEGSLKSRKEKDTNVRRL
jgi:hypothetical protein